MIIALRKGGASTMTGHKADSGTAAATSGDPFLTIAGEAEAETKVRGSRFIAVATPVGEEAKARALVEECSRSRFDATHHCAAWRLRNGSWRAIDGGEPSGSGGAPILAAIDAAGLVDVAVVVSRYFGGTKLGIGGLARAYSEAAASVLAGAPKQAGVVGVRGRVHYEYAHTAAIMRAIELFDAENIEYEFSAGLNEPAVTFSLAGSKLQEMGRYLRDASGGSLVIDIIAPLVLYRS